MKKVFTTGDVARICRVTINTVVKWFDLGEIEGYQIPGSGARRVTRKNLLKFMRKYKFPMDELAAEKFKILVADADRKVRSIFRRVFSDKEKYLLAEASSGFEAGLQAREFTPDVIFLDTGMAGIDSRTICKLLHENEDTATTRVVAICTDCDKRMEKALKRQGFAELIRKPLRKKHLLEVAERFSS